MSLFSATNQERPSEQLHNLANLLLLRFFLSKGGREGSRLLRVAIAILTLFLRLGRVVSNCTIKLFSGDPIASSINNFLKDHNEPCLAPHPPQKWITIASNFTWVLNRRRWLCKSWGVDKVYYGLCENGELTIQYILPGHPTTELRLFSVKYRKIPKISPSM